MSFEKMKFYSRIFGFICAVAIVVLCLQCGLQIEQNIKKAEQMIDLGCKVYLNGQEVNPDVIILEKYKIYFRDDIVILYD